jgi:hypothetical protein
LNSTLSLQLQTPKLNTIYTMSAKLLLLLSALAALSQAFTIPSGTENGIYIHTLNDNNTHTQTALDIAVTKRSVQCLGQNTKFKKRDLLFPFTTTYCGNGEAFMYNLAKHDFIQLRSNSSRAARAKISGAMATIITLCMARPLPLCATTEGGGARVMKLRRRLIWSSNRAVLLRMGKYW